MRTWRWTGALALLTVVSLWPAAARAQLQPQTPSNDWQRNTAIVGGSVLGAVDLFFIAYDLTVAERGTAPSRTLMLTELTLMTIQLAAGISMVATALQPDERLRSLGIDRDLFLPIGAIVTTVAVPLLIHAVSHTKQSAGSGMHAIRVLPSRLGDARASATGLVVAGVF